MSMHATLTRLFELIRARTGGADLPFNPGADPNEITAAWGTTGLPLPDDYRTFLETVNGQPADAQLFFPPGQLSFLALDEAVTMWQEFAGLEDEEEPFDELIDDDRVRAVGYHHQRFPIAHYETGVQSLFLDFIPGDAGRPGQLIFNPSESSHFVVAESFERLLSDYVYLLDSGLANLQRQSPVYGQGYWFCDEGGRPLSFEAYMKLVKTRG